ncbi:MAG: hypothetical protein H6724_10185 [Sandaracinus sp.]|nr:hypothetical protein [Sandaracinus sp.]
MITAIREHGATRVIALVSGDAPQTGQKGSYTKLDEIAKSSGLGREAFEELRVPADDLGEIFRRCVSCLESVPDTALIEYSGGTKLMSSGVVLAASVLPEKVERLPVVGGPRRDLVKVTMGSETQNASLEPVRDRHRSALATAHLDRFTYASAVTALKRDG